MVLRPAHIFRLIIQKQVKLNPAIFYLMRANFEFSCAVSFRDQLERQVRSLDIRKGDISVMTVRSERPPKPDWHFLLFGQSCIYNAAINSGRTLEQGKRRREHFHVGIIQFDHNLIGSFFLIS